MAEYKAAFVAEIYFARAGLRMLRPNRSHTRLKQPLFCPTCDRIVSRDEVIKGYECEEGHYVLVDKDDLKNITPKSGRVMEIPAFVKEEQIDPVYFDASYVALPDVALPEKDADKPYQILLKALADTHRAGIATVTMHQREYTVFIRPRDNGITVHTMYFQNEIRQVPGYGEKPKDLHLKPQEVKLAEQLIETLSEDFNPKQYRDTFQEKLRELVQAKQKGKTVTEGSAPGRGKVIDMMDAPKKSLRETGGAGIGRGTSKGTVHTMRSAR